MANLQKAFENAFERLETPLTIEGKYVMKGICAALSLNSSTHILVTAPNWECLRRAWEILTKLPLDETKAQVVCEALIGKLDYSEIEPSSPKPIRPIRPERPKADEMKKLHWFYDKQDKSLAQYFYYGNDNGKVKLGLVVDGTEAEAKTYMRKLGMARSVIQEAWEADDIPF